MKLKNMPLGPLETNCYIVYQEQDALIFDPGGDPDRLISWVDQSELNPKAILLTHAHFDHIGAVDQIREYYHIPVYVHEQEKEWLTNATLNGSVLFPVDEIATKNGADYFLANGNTTIGEFQYEVRHTPGHSPGGVIFIFHDQQLIIGGDSLFRLGIGRTDLPGGDYDQLIVSIKQQIFTLPNNYTVYPGHGSETTIGIEREQNPFLR